MHLMRTPKWRRMCRVLRHGARLSTSCACPPMHALRCMPSDAGPRMVRSMCALEPSFLAKAQSSKPLLHASDSTTMSLKTLNGPPRSSKRMRSVLAWFPADRSSAHRMPSRLYDGSIHRQFRWRTTGESKSKAPLWVTSSSCSSWSTEGVGQRASMRSNSAWSSESRPCDAAATASCCSAARRLARPTETETAWPARTPSDARARANS